MTTFQTEKKREMSDKSDKIKEAIRPSIKDPFENGDVIRFVYKREYLYAVLKADGRFYATGNGSLVPKTMEFAELAHFLARPGVTDIEWTDQWTRVK